MNPTPRMQIPSFIFPVKPLEWFSGQQHSPGRVLPPSTARFTIYKMCNDPNATLGIENREFTIEASSLVDRADATKFAMQVQMCPATLQLKVGVGENHLQIDL